MGRHGTKHPCHTSVRTRPRHISPTDQFPPEPARRRAPTGHKPYEPPPPDPRKGTPRTKPLSNPSPLTGPHLIRHRRLRRPPPRRIAPPSCEHLLRGQTTPTTIVVIAHPMTIPRTITGESAAAPAIPPAAAMPTPIRAISAAALRTPGKRSLLLPQSIHNPNLQQHPKKNQDQQNRDDHIQEIKHPSTTLSSKDPRPGPNSHPTP